MNPLKKLAGQTAIYGISTILPRFLNYLLVILFTYKFQKTSDFGINTEIYAYISFLNIIVTYGMETGFFNFNSKLEDKAKVYSTSLISLLSSSGIFMLLGCLLAVPIASALDYANHVSFIIWMILIIGTDAITAIPFARLRAQNKAKRFALIKIINILTNVSLNVFIIWFCKDAYEGTLKGEAANWMSQLYDPNIGIGYAFLINLIANLITIILLLPEFKGFEYVFDKTIWKQMMRYSLPLLVVGLAGMVNETFDRIILKHLSPGNGQSEVGIYGACYKISILMTIFIQAFRFAAEPFFFSHNKHEDSKKMNAIVMKYFSIFCSFLFLATMMNLPWIKYMIAEPYRVGLGVVPILLLANFCLGIYYNLSIWYKLTGQTKFGAGITIVGASITLVINFLLIPIFSYTASAWATLLSYATMMVISYRLGQKHYPVKYNLRSMFFFFILALLAYFISLSYKGGFSVITETLLNNIWLFLFMWIFYKVEWPRLRSLKTETSSN